MRVSRTIWKKQPPQSIMLPELRLWYQSEPGKTVLAMEQALVEAELATVFGYHVLQLGVSPEVCLLEDCRIQHKICCSALQDRQSSLCSEFDQLPFASDSLDAVVIHHAHEFAANPHAVLREVQRVLVPQGRLIVVGFNPWSCFGVYGLATRLLRLRASIWHNHWVSQRRMGDWLNLLGFRVSQRAYLFHRLPLRKQALLSRCAVAAGSVQAEWLQRLPSGGSYVVSAIKELPTITPVRPQWRRARGAFAGLSVVKPTATPLRRSTTKEKF